MKTHNLSNLFPRADKLTYEALKEDIANNGLQNPTIFTLHSKIIDGKTRYFVCEDLGITKQLQIIKLKDENEALHILISNNILRKQYTKSQIGIIGAKLLSKLTKWERENEGGRKVDKISKAIGVSSKYVQSGLKLIKGYPALAKLIEECKMSIKEADEITRQNKNLSDKEVMALWRKVTIKRAKEKEEELNRLRSKIKSDLPSIDEMYSLYVQDIKDYQSNVKPKSIDLILTDAPYLQKYQDCYYHLGKWASRNLKDNGILIAYSHIMNVDLHIKLLSENMLYRYMIVLKYEGNKCPISHVGHIGIRNHWKPLLIYTKSHFPIKTYNYMTDILESQYEDNQKGIHIWGQNIKENQDLIRAFVKPGSLVCDTFLGSGSTCIAALREGCKFIGMDIDKSCIQATKKRIEEEYKEEYKTEKKKKVA